LIIILPNSTSTKRLTTFPPHMKHFSMLTPPYPEARLPLFLARYVDGDYYKCVFVKPAYNVERAAVFKPCQHQATMTSWVIWVILYKHKTAF